MNKENIENYDHPMEYISRRLLCHHLLSCQKCINVVYQNNGGTN